MSLTISSFSTSQPTGATSATGSNATVRKNGQQDVPTEGTDKVSLGQSATEGLTYNVPRSAVQSQAELQTMLEESSRKAQEIVDLILSMVNRQGTTLGEVIRGETSLQADPETIAAAQAAIAEDGEWGVQQTAARILDFSRAVIGGDSSKLESIRAAVEKGFREATEILGGKLPEISERTYAAVMAEFDRWREEGLPQETSPESASG